MLKEHDRGENAVFQLTRDLAKTESEIERLKQRLSDVERQAKETEEKQKDLQQIKLSIECAFIEMSDQLARVTQQKRELQ